MPVLPSGAASVQPAEDAISILVARARAETVPAAGGISVETAKRASAGRSLRQSEA